MSSLSRLKYFLLPVYCFYILANSMKSEIKLLFFFLFMMNWEIFFRVTSFVFFRKEHCKWIYKKKKKRKRIEIIWGNSCVKSFLFKNCNTGKKLRYEFALCTFSKNCIFLYRSMYTYFWNHLILYVNHT